MSKKELEGIYDFEIINGRMQPIAEKLVAKYEELKHINPAKILFVLNHKSGSSKKGKVTLANTSRLPQHWTEILYQISPDKSYFYKIEFYAKTTSCMDNNQMIALLYNELRKIGPEGKIIAPDTHSWWNMIMGLGHTWFYPNETCANLLDEGVDWESLVNGKTGQKNLFK